MSHIDSHLQKVLAAPPGELFTAGSRLGCFDSQVDLVRNGRWPKLSRISSALTVSTWIWRHRRELHVIHANGLSELNLVGMGAFVTRTPVVVWNHSSSVSPIAGRLARLWRHILTDVRWSAVSRVAVQALCDAAGIGAEDSRIIANPIDAVDIKAAREPHIGSVRIGFLGSASENKGYPLIPDVVAALSDRAAVWLLFTSVPDSGRATDVTRRLRAMDCVSIVGRVSDAADAYKRCDIVFVPSLIESFGRVPAEAMLNGLPVVASDVPAFRDLIGVEAGILFPPGSSAGAADALKRLIDSRSLRDQMGAAGRQRVAKFAPAVIVPQLLELYAIPDHGAPHHSERDSGRSVQ